MPARKSLKLAVRWYRASTRVYGGVEIGVLEPAGGKEVLASTGDPLDAMLRVAEEEARSAKADYMEVIVDDGETKRILGSTPRHTWSRPLFYRPERLLRVGIVKLPPASPSSSEVEKGEGEDGQEDETSSTTSSLEVRLDKVEWYNVDGEVYVFEGKAQLVTDEEGEVIVLIETPSGLRLVKASPAALRRRRSS